MTSEPGLSRDACLMIWDLRIFWAVAGIYAAASLVLAVHIIGRNGRAGSLARAVMTAGVALHLVLIAFRTYEGARAPFQTLYESLSWFAFMAQFTYLVVSRRWKGVHLPAMLVGLVSTGACLYALTGRSPAVDPLSPPLQSYWFEWHVVLAFLAYAVFVVSCSIEGAYLAVRPFLKKDGDRRLYGLSPAGLDAFRRTSFRLVLFGFPLLTFAVFSGAAWANEAWGRYWSWDPKETWSLITWTVFAMYLHAMGVSGWRGNVASFLNILGFVCMMMTFLGVNWLAKLLGIPGLHLYAV